MVRAVVVVGHQPYSLSVAKAAERLKGEIDVEMFYMWDLRERPEEFEEAMRRADFAVLNVMDSATAEASTWTRSRRRRPSWPSTPASRSCGPRSRAWGSRRAASSGSSGG